MKDIPKHSQARMPRLKSARLLYPRSYTLHFEQDINGFVSAMKVTMNWFRKTTGYCAYFYNAEIISLVRINGKTIRNSTAHAWFPDEVIELIDIPHEVKDLGIL